MLGKLFGYIVGFQFLMFAVVLGLMVFLMFCGIWGWLLSFTRIPILLNDILSFFLAIPITYRFLLWVKKGFNTPRNISSSYSSNAKSEEQIEKERIAGASYKAGFEDGRKARNYEDNDE